MKKTKKFQPGHGRAVDDGGRCEGELGSGVGALVRLEGVASILVRVPEDRVVQIKRCPFFIRFKMLLASPLALELVHSIVPCDLVVVHNVPEKYS